MSTYLSLCKCIQDKHWHTHIYEWESTHTQISRETNSSLCFHVVKVGINAVRGFKVSVSSLCEIEMCVYSGVSAQLFSSVRLDLYLLSLYLVALFPWLEAVKSKSSYSTVKEKQPLFMQILLGLFIFKIYFSPWNDDNNVCWHCIQAVVNQHLDRCHCSDECLHHRARRDGFCSSFCGCHGNANRAVYATCPASEHLAVLCPYSVARKSGLSWYAISACLLFQ